MLEIESDGLLIEYAISEEESDGSDIRDTRHSKFMYHDGACMAPMQF
jgi:hypothetical protein